MEPSALRMSSTSANSGAESVRETVPESEESPVKSVVSVVAETVRVAVQARPATEKQSISSYQA